MISGPNMKDEMRSSFAHHDGSACPLDPQIDVLVIRRRIIREGTPDFATGKAADFDWDWSDEDPGNDVVSYRLVDAESLVTEI